MIRYVLALGLTAVGLFGFNAWSSWFLDQNAAAREFFAGRTFTLALLLGGAFAMCVCTFLVAALIFGSDSPSGRTEPEDHA